MIVVPNGLTSGVLDEVIGNSSAAILKTFVDGGADYDELVFDDPRLLVGDVDVGWRYGPNSDISAFTLAESSILMALAEDGSGQLTFTVSYRGAPIIFVTDFQRIEGFGGSFWNDRMVGNSSANGLRGMNGNDTIIGGDGDDTINGGAGADSMSGGDGVDLLSYEGDTTGVQVSLAQGSATGGDASGLGSFNEPATDVFDGFENLSGGLGGDMLEGDNAANAVWGQEGDDTLSGLDGNDTLYGGLGADSLEGGEGDDLLQSGAAPLITIPYIPPSLTVGAFYPSIAEAFEMPSEFLLLKDPRNDIETDLDPTIRVQGRGDDNASQFFKFTMTQEMRDSMVGSQFSIILNHGPLSEANGAGVDVAYLRLFTAAGVEVNRVTVSSVPDANGNPAITYLFFTQPVGDYYIEVYGAEDAGVNLPLDSRLDYVVSLVIENMPAEPGDVTTLATEILDGGAGDDTLIAENGNDILKGGEGDDSLRGGSGDDSMQGDAGINQLDGGQGEDTVILQHALADYLIGGAQGGYSFTYTGTGPATRDEVRNFETYQFADQSLTAAEMQAAYLAKDTKSDFNGDALDDILWRTPDGDVLAWLIKDGAVASEIGLGTASSDWSVVGIGDFVNDGSDDVLMQGANGDVVVWNMELGTQVGEIRLGAASSEWQIVGVGDFAGDGSDDVLLQKSDGQIVIWNVEDGVRSGGTRLGSASSAWEVAGVGDFSGDGFDDILLHKSDGQIVIWDIENGVRTGGTRLGAASSAWEIAGVGDFSGDGFDDILLHKSDGQIVIWDIENGARTGGTRLGAASTAWDVAGVGDFSGDGFDDILLQKTDGQVVIWDIENGARTGGSPLGLAAADWGLLNGNPVDEFIF